MARSPHNPERRKTTGARVRRDDWLALRRDAAEPMERVVHDMDDGLARLDRKLARLKKTLEDAVHAP